VSMRHLSREKTRDGLKTGGLQAIGPD